MWRPLKDRLHSFEEILMEVYRISIYTVGVVCLLHFLDYGSFQIINQMLIKRHYMRKPGTDGNLSIRNAKVLRWLTTEYSENLLFWSFRHFFYVHHFTWNLLENMMNRFLQIPGFAWISHAFPLNMLNTCRTLCCQKQCNTFM